MCRKRVRAMAAMDRALDCSIRRCDAVALTRESRLGRGSRKADEMCVVLDRARVPDEITLHFVARSLDEKRELFSRLDAFGEHAEAEAVGEIDDAAHQGAGLAV